MKQSEIIEIGNITNQNQDRLLRMWTVNVPGGKRPLQPHQHIHFEIMYVNSGNGVYTVGEKDYPILPGDIFVFSSNEFHCITDVGSKGLQITNLHFDPRFIWNSSYNIGTQVNINFCFSHQPDFENRIISTDAIEILALLLQIQRELSAQPPEYHLAAKSLLHLLLVMLVRQYHYLNDLVINPNQLQSIQCVLSYIDVHFAEKISLEELASLVGLTGTYFSALFKKVVGISLWEYISSKRIDKAIRLIALEGREKNMLDIAFECGFNNTANFNKTFKRVTGTTPREYKSSGNLGFS